MLVGFARFTNIYMHFLTPFDNFVLLSSFQRREAIKSLPELGSYNAHHIGLDMITTSAGMDEKVERND